jgi:hypothetical protein
VHSSESSPEDQDGQCAKLRDWLWWKCRKFFRTRTVKFAGTLDVGDWRQLRDEICAPTYKIANGKIKVEDKDEMKKRGIRSPNLADALNLTFFRDYEMWQVNYASSSGTRQRKDSYHDIWKKKKAPLGWKSR